MNFLKKMIAIILGHITVFKHVFKKRVTLLYPEKKRKNVGEYRGVHALVCDENSKIICGGCATCQRVCPSFGTIKIDKQKDESGKFVVKNYEIDLSKCIFCGNCVYHCPQKAIIFTENFELANENISALNLDINSLKNNYLKHIINNEEKLSGN